LLREGSTDAEKALAGRHWAYSIDLLKKGIVIFGGRTVITTDDAFAIMVFPAQSEADARAIAEAIPQCVADYFVTSCIRISQLMGE